MLVSKVSRSRVENYYKREHISVSRVYQRPVQAESVPMPGQYLDRASISFKISARTIHTEIRKRFGELQLCRDTSIRIRTECGGEDLSN